MAADMLTNLVRELDDHDLSVLHTRNTQNGLVGVACVNPLHKKFSRAGRPIDIVSNLFDPPIYLSKPSAVATSPFSELFCQQGYYFGK